MPHLATETTNKVKALCADAYSHYDQGEFRKALRLFYQAWVLLPKPQTHYAEAGWVLVGIGDTYFRLRQYTPGSEALRSADHCPECRGNPFIQLRLGQCLYHLGERLPSRNHLQQAYTLGGKALFQNEDPCYLNTISEFVAAKENDAPAGE